MRMYRMMMPSAEFLLSSSNGGRVPDGSMYSVEDCGVGGASMTRLLRRTVDMPFGFFGGVGVIIFAWGWLFVF